MFRYRSNHLCTVRAPGSSSFLPPLDENATCFARARRQLHKLILISENHPQSLEYFRSTAEIIDERKKQVESRSWIIHPFSIFKLYYEFYMVAIFLMCMVYMPLDAAFLQNFTTIWYHVFDMIVSACCFIDVILRFGMGYADTNEKIVVMKKKKIIKRYVFGVHFVGDFFSSIPSVPGVKMWWGFRLFSLLKITRIVTLFEYLDHLGEFVKISGITYDALKLIMKTVLVIHFLACWMFLNPRFRYVMTGEYHSENWVIRQDLLNADLDKQYMVSFMKASSYILGVDISLDDVTVWEDFTVFSFAYILGKIYLLYTFVIVLYILMAKRSLEIKYHCIMSQVDCFISANKVPPHMKARVLEYYKYKYDGKYYKEYGTKDFFSDSLKREINYNVLQKLVQSVSLFQGLPKRAIENILWHLEKEIYLPHDIILKAGAPGDCMYFLASGTVAVTTPSGREVCHLQDGAHFGEVALMNADNRRTATVTALELCETYKLSRKGFKKCFSKDPELYKQLVMMAEQRTSLTDVLEAARRATLRNVMDRVH